MPTDSIVSRTTVEWCNCEPWRTAERATSKPWGMSVCRFGISEEATRPRLCRRLAAFPRMDCAQAEVGEDDVSALHPVRVEEAACRQLDATAWVVPRYTPRK